MTDVSIAQDISKNEEVYWVKSVLALKITSHEAMAYLARSIFKQFFNSLNFYEKINLENLLDIAQNRHKDYKLRRVKDRRVWVVNSPECKSLLEKLVSAHWDPAFVEWDNIGDTNVERYWKIAKLYMPHGNKDSTCPEDTDMIAIFHMLRNFKVKDFAEERKEIDEMICHVNYLLRTLDNKISETKMSSILENIYQFMKSTELSEGIKSKTKDKLQKVQLISNCDEWYKKILPKQKAGLALERDRNNQFLNITEKLLVEFSKEIRYTMEPAYYKPLSDKIKDATAGRDIGTTGGAGSLLYGSTLDATAGETSYLWKKRTVNPPSQSSDQEHKKSTQRRYRSPYNDKGYIESQPDKSTDDQSPDKEHKKTIQRKLSSSDSVGGKIESQPSLSDLEIERYFNIREKLLVDLSKETRFTMKPAYNKPLSDKTKDATAGRDIGTIGEPGSLLYGSTLGATTGRTSYRRKSMSNVPFGHNFVIVTIYKNVVKVTKIQILPI
ncbi:uncharacterized protein LOC132743251 [Ruditapes philippinarum]|uniref:uncharacterized protein LOC132743251 n=1 Tax=Ruditapes philippinarum TaxID=129788 RepID=UPI00295AEE70|nr:uncharacterized protein LOC132743251 [Ruditapes philippinarum]